MNGKVNVLIGNSFPMSLIRRDVNIRVVEPDALRKIAGGAKVVSYWGHENSRAVAEAFLGVSLAPSSPRPAIMLTEDNLPSLDGIVFRSCYVCSPQYVPGFRPAIGEEVAPASIRGWQILRIDWR